MIKQYTQEEKWKLYEELPKKIQSVFWDGETGQRVIKIIERFGLGDKEEDTLMEIVFQMFLGVLPPSQAQKHVKEEFDESTAIAIFQEIVRFIIYPTQKLLRDLYAEEEFSQFGVKESFSDAGEERRWKSSFGDTYREEVED